MNTLLFAREVIPLPPDINYSPETVVLFLNRYTDGNGIINVIKAETRLAYLMKGKNRTT